MVFPAVLTTSLASHPMEGNGLQILTAISIPTGPEEIDVSPHSINDMNSAGLLAIMNISRRNRMATDIIAPNAAIVAARHSTRST